MGALTPELLKYGPAGLAIVALAWVIRVLWEENKLLRSQINTLQETRVSDANAAATRLLENSTSVVTALNRSSAAQEASSDALRDFEQALESLGRKK